MPIPILTTKLYSPPLRPDAVLRPRLIERLNEGLHRKLTLISAPAGCGKTMLVSEWLSQIERPFAWLSLDERDNDLSRFLAYLVAAIQRIDASIGQEVLALLETPQTPALEIVLTTLLNDLIQIPENSILVLDDLHLLDSTMIDEALNFLLDNLPPQLHLVIASREDPQLPLARLRARNQLTELRAADLRFTVSEAGDFLNQAMSLNLTEDDILALETRTEGWIAGLQLAAISMQGHEDTREFIESFTGSHHFVLDYLLAEVLQQQPEKVQNFLLQTSILERMSASLAAAILNESLESVQETLDTIVQSNLFIIPLDNERRWYRYHHLFGDLLHQRLQNSSDINELHIRASIWHEENGFELDAFFHAASANDIERAERLIEGDKIPFYFRGIVAPILNWLESLPEDVLDARPSLRVMHAMVLSFTGRSLEEPEASLQIAEAAIKATPDNPNNRNLEGSIAAVRAMLAIPNNQIDSILEQSQLALELLHPDKFAVRANAAWTLAYGYQVQGQRGAAIEAYSEVIPASEATGNTMVTIAAAIGLGGLQKAENQLHRASETFHYVIQLSGEPPFPPASVAYLGLSRLNYEWNRLDLALEQAQQALKLGMQLKTVDTPIAALMVIARIKLLQGDVSRAVSALAEAEQLIHERQLLFIMPDIISIRVLIALHQGNLEKASQLAQSQDIPISQIRVHLARGDTGAALKLLETLHTEAETKDFKNDLLQAKILRSIAHQMDNRIDAALQILTQALNMTEAEGFIRSYIDESRPMKQLLSEAKARGIMPDYVTHLLSEFEGHTKPSPAQDLIEPMSERELEVLGLIAEGLSNREISERLFLALDTIKGHNRRIFAKLHVKNRTEAVARARELSLI